MGAVGVGRPDAGRRNGLVRRQAGLLRCDLLARRPQRPDAKLDLPTDVSIEAHRGWLAVKRRTAWTVGGKTYAPDTLLGISLPAFLGRRARFHGAVRAGRAAGAAGLLLERRAAGRFDPRRAEARVRGADAVGRPAGRGRSCRGCPRSAWSMSGALDMEEAEGNGDLLANAQDPITPATHDADRARHGARRAQAGAAYVRCRWAGRHAARGGLHRRRAHSLCAGRPGRRDRRRAGAS